MHKLFQTIYYVRDYGLAHLLFRLRYAASLRMGLHKRKFPARSWEECELKHWLKSGVLGGYDDYKAYRRSLTSATFFFDATDLPNLALSDPDDAVRAADEILQGTLTYFSKLKTHIGSMPSWHRNPFTGECVPRDRHWTAIGDFAAGQGDIKFIWEPSRFAWVYPLVRAYAATDDEKYAEHFWNWFDDWMTNNPPNIGANYKCGQECAIRCMAVCFALFAFFNAQVTTSKRLADAVAMLAMHAERIEGNTAYAQWQKNNHAISEANGLYTIGVLFPELQDADRWRTTGKAMLEEEARRQIYDDGSYIQHSMNYHRLMLQHYIWAVRLGELNSDPFSDELKSRVEKATEFLLQMQDPVSGRVPNYGANDGALILALNACDYLDYRPVIQAGRYLLKRQRVFPRGLWDEDLVWLFGNSALDTEQGNIERRSSAFDAGGYYTLRGKRSWAMIRCHTYRDRPSQADILHVDLWCDGVNVLRDSGTYAYHTDAAWKAYFVASQAHNTVEIDQREHMIKGSGFLWFNWTRANLLKHASSADRDVFVGERLSRPRHRRTVCRFGPEVWVIVDDILGYGRHRIDQYWQLAKQAEVTAEERVVTIGCDQRAFTLQLLRPDHAMYQCHVGRERPRPCGWVSEYYGRKEPAAALVCTVETLLPARLITTFCRPDVDVKLDNDVITATLPDGSTSSLSLADMNRDEPRTAIA